MPWSVVSDGDHRASVTLGPSVLVYVQVSVTGQGLERWSPLGQMAVVGSAGTAVVVVVVCWAPFHSSAGGRTRQGEHM